jgi:hypothetical protein
MTTLTIGIAIGVAAAVGARAAFARAVLAKLRRDVTRLNDGDYRPLLAGYDGDAVLYFNEGDHRWSGEHRGRSGIERFLSSFAAAGLTGEINALWLAGPPWAMTILVRFDDKADGPDGERIYENRTVLWARTSWGRIVEQRDFYEDTRRISDFDRRLREIEAGSVAAGASQSEGETT